MECLIRIYGNYPPYCTSQGKAGAPPYLRGESLGISRPGLPSKWSMQNSFVHQTITFKINNAVHFSHSQNCKVNYLELQIWHSKPLRPQSIMFTWALQLICPWRTMSQLFPVKVRLCASKVKVGHMWLPHDILNWVISRMVWVKLWYWNFEQSSSKLYNYHELYLSYTANLHAFHVQLLFSFA